MALKQLLTNLSDSSTPVDSSAYPTQASHLEGVTFNQRSFRFGEGRQSDRSGGGFSREPFIGNPRALFGVDTNDSDLSDANDSLSGLENTLSVVDGVTNGLVRGGIVTALKRSLTDTQRITNFYVSERGFGFLLKQTLLQTTNPSIEDGGISILGLRRNRQFNFLGTNLLAQSLVNFSGVHFDRAGLLPIWPEDRKYETVVSNPDKANNIGKLNTTTGKTNTFEGNRLLTLFGAHIQDDEVQGVEGNKETKTPKTGFGRLAAQGKDLVQSITGKNSPMLYEYGAGPGSTYGIGRTSIRKFEDTTNSPNIQKTKARTARIGDTITPDIGTINYLRLIGRPANDYNFRKTREYRVGTGGSATAADAANNFYVYDATASTHRLTLNSSGNFGIGTISPAFKLTVDGIGSEGAIGIERDTVSASTIIGALNFTNNNGGTIYGRVRGGRNSNSMENFMKVQDVSPEALMKLLSEKAIVLENSDNELYNILKNDAEKKYGGEQ